LRGLISGVYLASGREAPPTFAAVYVFGFLWMIGWWFRDDSKRRQIRWVYDIGFFLYLAWPFVLPYYLLKSRGVKGIIAVLAFIGVYLGATVLGIVLSVARSRGLAHCCVTPMPSKRSSGLAGSLRSSEDHQSGLKLNKRFKEVCRIGSG
jgi:hypothetical protein